MKIVYECKLCRQTSVAETEDGDNCPPDWIERLKKLLTCNPCSDLRSRFRTAERQIYDACTKLVRMKLMRVSEEDRQLIRKKVDQALRHCTLRYAQAMAVYRKLPKYVWDEDFVFQLMEKPDDATGILRRYRAMLKSNFQPVQTEYQSPTADP
jgi:hypothetical protein